MMRIDPPIVKRGMPSLRFPIIATYILIPLYLKCSLQKHRVGSGHIIHIIINIFSNCIHSTGALSVSVDSTSTTSLTISWILHDSVTATSYTISYSITNTQCFTESYDDVTGITDSETMYTLAELQEGAEYSINVTAILSDGQTEEDSLRATIMATGWYTYNPSLLSPIF